MQVATLFREATSLLGATMEAPEGTSLKLYWNPIAEGAYQDSVGMKSEPPHDDGYETAGGGELDIPNQHHVSNQMALVPKMPSHPLQGSSNFKYEMPDDPYSFVDDEHMMAPVQCPPSVMPPAPKKRGRKKKIKTEDMAMPCHDQGFLHSHRPVPNDNTMNPGMFSNSHENWDRIPEMGMGYPNMMGCLPNQMKDRNSAKVIKERKKHDRFNGMPEEEVSKRTLPDHLTQNLDIVIIGINPGLFAAYKGHHYAGPGNHFWKCLYLSGLTPEPMTADDDYKLLKVGIGFTNMVERATKGSADLTRKEIKEGSQILLEKLQKFKPKIAVFNGKLIFEVFSGKKDFSFGRQPELVDGTNTYMWVMPSSSARCAQLPRAADKVPFYAALKKFRDYLNGTVSEIDDKELVFSYSKLKNFFEPEIKEEGKDGQCVYNYSKVNNKLTDISNSGKKEDEPVQPKKKRGRPKKIKVEGEPKPEEPKPKIDDKTGAPKKKRGRPKKIKVDPDALPPSEHSNPPNHCFSPPIQSPIMQNFPMYQQPHYNHNQSSQSPLPNSFHQSPMQSHGYNQSPQPPSFTHSDLSSEISAAISSEHNPESPSLGPPDFEPPGNMAEEASKSPQQKDEECHFSSPQSKKSYQTYDDFSTDSDSGIRYPPKPINQDVSSKSLSGLESLVDQIPNITDGEPSHSVISAESEHLGSQYSDDSAYLSDYPRTSHYSPQYNTTTSNSYMQHSNFSVTSLANSSATDTSFSVSSLASNYTPTSYPNLMGPPMSSVMESNASSPGGDRACRIDPSVNMSSNQTFPYPYSQYSSPYPNTSTGFYPPSHNLPMPSPNFPYPPPYSNSPYPQPSSYLPNHMFDRIKPDRMDIGFGGF